MKLEVKNISFSHPGGTFFLKDVSLTVEKGTIFGIGGENGSGKSSLLKVLFKHYQHNSGSVLIDGKDISKLRQRVESQICWNLQREDVKYEELSTLQSL